MKPLEDVLVVSIEQAVAAPLCTARLVAAGARVIKVERKDGDFARAYDTAASGASSYFTWLNGEKESICLDFKSPSGSSLLRSMLSRADIFIQNLAPGAISRAGFSPEELRRINPKLVVCNISGFGDVGDLSRRRGYDLLVQAEAGLVSVSGSPGHPGRIGVSICDIGTGLTAYSGVLEALLAARISGRGAHISVSLFDVAAEWMTVPLIHTMYGQGAPEPVGLRHPSIAPYGAYPTAEGSFILIAVQNEREWARFRDEVLGSNELKADSRFSTNDKRVQHREVLETLIADQTRSFTFDALCSRLEASTIAFGALNTPDQLVNHPGLRWRQITAEDGQIIRLPELPVVWSDQSSAGQEHVPGLGEHTEKLVTEFS